MTQPSFAGLQVRILEVSGDVKSRRGVEENWEQAQAGQLLEEIDTILTGSGSRIKLKIIDGKIFELGSDSILDLVDLRPMSEDELFLQLMSFKINKIEPRSEKSRLRISNVTVIHGESRVSSGQGKTENKTLPLEMNGARALYSQSYYPNTIIRLYKIMSKYVKIDDCGEIHYYLGKSFEALDKKGQALDAYEVALKKHEEQGCHIQQSNAWYPDVRHSIEKLKNN